MYFNFEMVEAAPVPTWLAVTDGTHCGVEPTGSEIIKYLEARDPIPGVCYIKGMHPRALREGVRFIDERELGAHFTEEVRAAPLKDLDADQISARRFMDAPLQDIWLGIDPHDSPAPNADSLQVSEFITMIQLGVAGVMELRNVVILPKYPFLIMNRAFVLVETERAPATNRLSQPWYWSECLTKMSELGPDRMEQLGSDIYRDLNYFVKVELMRTDDKGNPNPEAINRISRLEGVAPVGPYFTPIDPAHPVFAAYPSMTNFTGRLYAGYWDDNSHAPQRADILGYRPDGNPRRTAFGSLLLKVSVDDFATVQQPRWEYERATLHGD
jgi:hypothetical protein